MRKRFLSIFLVLALCLAYTPAVPKVYATDHTIGTAAELAALTLEDADTVTLTADIDASAVNLDLTGISMGANITFVLNGFALTVGAVTLDRGNLIIQGGTNGTFTASSITKPGPATSGMLELSNVDAVCTGNYTWVSDVPSSFTNSTLTLKGAVQLDYITVTDGLHMYELTNSKIVIENPSSVTVANAAHAAEATAFYTDRQPTHISVANAGTNITFTNNLPDGTTATAEKVVLKSTFESATATTPPANANPTYNGTAQALYTEGATDSGTFYYRASAADPWSTDLPTGINAGDYAADYYIAGDAEHDDKAAESVIAHIDQAHVTITVLNRNILLNESAPSLAAPQEGVDYTVEGLYGTDTVTNVQLSYRSGGAVVASPDTSAQTMYDIWVDSATVGANYLFDLPADMVAGTLFITEYPIATYTVTPTDLNLVYNGQPQALAVAASDQGQVQYEYGGNFYTAAPEETDAGNYTVSVSIFGTPGQYSSGGETIVHTEIQPAAGLTLAAKNTTITKGTAILDTHLYQLTTGELKGTDEIELTVDWVAGAAPDVNTPGTYEFNIAGYTIAAPGLGSNYAFLLTGETHGILKIQESSGSGPSKNNSYDHTQPDEGVGSGKIDDEHWPWGDRANLPKDLATLYMVLSNNSVSKEEDKPLYYPHLGTYHFLASDETWKLPEVDPDYGPYDVQTVLVCEDHEPIYLANGDGKVDQSTFGNSDFYTVGVGTGDTKIDYPNLKTGDVVSNTTFNGVFVTKLQKSNNPTFDADLAKLKSDTIASFRAFELDHPEVFWLNGSVKLRVLTVTLGSEQTSFIFMTLVDDKGFTMRIAEYAAAGSIEAGIKQRDAAVAAIIAQIPAGASDREKVVNLNKWFTLNNEYNRSADLSSIGFTPHRSLKSLTGNFGINGPVCDGYSRGFKTVCDRLGIPVVLETGVASIGSHSELHMWMSIKIDGTWYGTDCTWDDPIVKGKDGKVSGYENEKYLLVGNETVVDGAKFGVSHPANKTPGGTTGVLFASLILNPNEIYGYTAIDYDDVKSTDWFFDYVQDVSARGLMNGTSPNLFSPQGTATRGQIVQILYNIAGQPEVEDVKVEGWFGTPATWALNKGIVAGYPDGDFHGNDPVTREQLATILWAFEGSPAVTGQIGFADAGTISDWAQQPMLWAKLEGILGGKPGNLADPQGTATRAEIATIFSNYMK